MRSKPIEQEQFRKIEQLANRGGGMLAGLSPNDVLVQIALPLVLILAIATRLITMSQAMLDHSPSTVFLDLWKQQLILRMEQVLGDWERSAGLHILEDQTRITWEAQWPHDEGLSRLFTTARALDDIGTLSLELYRQALRYTPTDTGAASAFFPLYDPQESMEEGAVAWHEDFVVTPERRAFALRYLRERTQQWSDTVQEAQWDVVARITVALPPDDDLSEGRIATQMQRIADELGQRGYPLLADVARAYGQNGGE